MAHPASAGKIRIKAVLFDFDGTLTAPGALDFPGIKAELGCPPKTPILEFIHSLENPHDQAAAWDRLARFEIAAACRSIPNREAVELVRWIKRRPLPIGIITRNGKGSVVRALENFKPLASRDFDLILTRDDAPAPKPSGDGILWAARKFQIEPREIMMVGDFIFDCLAGQDAGAVTVLLDPDDDPRFRDVACDHRIRRLGEIKALLLDS